MQSKLKLLLGLLLFTKLLFPQQNCENGYSIQPVSQWKILVVWAEVTTGGFTQASDVAGYGKGALPADANDFFDLSYTSGVEPTAYLSKYFYQMSFGKHVITCDHLDHTIQMDQNDPNLGFGLFSGYRNIYDYLNALYAVNPSQFSANYLVGQSPLSDFDKYTILPNYAGLPKANIANTKFDGIIILWKNNPSYGGGGAAFVPQAGNGNYATLGFTGVENDAAFGGDGGLGTKNFIIQEYFHGLFGGNEYHTGAGAGTSAFMTFTNPYGIPAQLAGFGISNAANGWDRDRLGWYGWKDLARTVPKTNLIATVDPSNTEVNTDFTVQSNLGSGLFVLRDHVMYGDAIRIKLPHLQDDPAYPTAKNQYLWIENHQKISEYDHGQWEGTSPCKDPTKPGMWAFIQAGKDIKTGTNTYNSNPTAANGCSSYIYPFTANGNWDYVYSNPTSPTNWPDCNWNNPYVVIDRNDPNNKANPFIGYNTLFNFWNANGDNKLARSSGDIYLPGYAEMINGNIVVNGFYHGDGYNAFNFATGKTKISLSSNPSATPVYTYATPNYNNANTNVNQHTQTYENRSIWLNGISVEILQENYDPATFGQGAILVKVRMDNYEVNQPVRWCGNIKVSPNDFDATPSDFSDNMYAINVTSGGSILVDRSKSYTRHWAVDQDPQTNEYRFSEPTEMTILPNAYFHMESGTNMIIDGESTVRIKNNGRLELHEYGSITVKKGSKLILESGAQLAIWDNAIVKVEAGGQLEYDNSTIDLIGNNSILEFEGNLKLANNADFKFIGLGFVKFSQQGWINPGWNPSNIIAGTGSKITLTGTNKNDKVLEVTQESMYCHLPLSKFTLQNGTAELGNDARISVDGDLLVSNAKITSTAGSLNNHRGLNTYGQSNVVINSSTFEKGKYGIYSTLTYGGAPITINNSLFQNCQTGLTTVDKGATLNNCTFQNNTIYGWNAVGMTFPCYASNSTAKLNPIGYNFTATGTSSLFVNKPTITQNTSNGIVFDGASMLTIACGSVTNNGLSANGSGVKFKNNSILNNNPTIAPNGGKTNMSGNYDAVQPVCANNWYLVGGRNNFTSNHRVASGTFNYSCISPLRQSGNNSVNTAQLASLQIDGLNNQWKNPNGAPVQNTNYNLGTCGCVPQKLIALNDNAPMNAIGCSIIPPDLNPNEINALSKADPIEHCPGCEKITTASFNNVKMNDAVKVAISNMEIADSTKDDVTAIKLLSEILTYRYAKGNFNTNYFTNEEVWLLEFSHSKIKEALSNAIQHNKVIPDLNSVSVQQVLISIDSVAKRINFFENTDKQLYFKLDKASVYKLINRRDKALIEIDAVKNCYVHDPEQTEYISNLRNVIYAEQLLVSGKVSKEDFLNTYEKLINGTSSFNTNGISIYSKTDSTETPGIKIVGDSVDFSASESGISNDWNFGDCSVSGGVAVKHSYNNPGNYTVKLDQSFACTNQTKNANITVLPNPSCSLTKAIVNKTCTSSNYTLFKTINLNDAASNCYSNGSAPLNTSNLRFKFDWDFNNPKKADFSETFNYNQIALHQDSLIHIECPIGDSTSIKLTTTMQINLNGTWVETGYKRMLNEVIFDGESFSGIISIDSSICQMDSVHFNLNIAGGISPYHIEWTFDNGLNSTEVNPTNIYKTSGEHKIEIHIEDSLGCMANVSFPQSVYHYHFPPNPGDSTAVNHSHGQEFTFEIQDCPSIKGYAIESSNCYSAGVPNLYLTLMDENKVTYSNIVAKTDDNGYFEFSPRKISALDPSLKYSVIAQRPSKYIVLKPEFSYLTNWINNSPLSIYVGSAKLDQIIKESQIESITPVTTIFDAENNKYIVGTITEGSLNYYTEKQDAIGNTVWISKYDGIGSGCDSAKAVFVDSSKNVYVTGKSWNGSDFDYLTIKYDSLGYEEWIAPYNDTTLSDDNAVHVCMDSLGKICVHGTTTNLTETKFTTIKYENCISNSNLTARMLTPKVDAINEIKVNNSDQIYVYPNPNNNGVLYLNSYSAKGSQFLLYNIEGKLLFSTIVQESRQQINLPQELLNGVYIYSVVDQKASSIVRKKLVLIKE